MNQVLQEKVEGLIREAGHILLLTDERIDGDTTGSTLGLCHVLKDLGKQVEVFSPKPLPAMLEFLPGTNEIRRDDSVFSQDSIDLVIICDCADGEYLKKYLPLLPKRIPLVVFDHHQTNPGYGTVNIIEPEAASTADVVWRFVKQAEYEVGANSAQCILTGIYTDTDAFSTTNTTANCLDASAELVKLGADPKTIIQHTMMNRSIASLKLWGIVLERLFHDNLFDATATVITLKDLELTGATEEDVSPISNFLNETLETKHEVVLVYSEKKDGCVKGSLRSRGRDVAVQAERLYGGGGHKLAAGFKVNKAKLEKAGEKWAIVKTGILMK
ncbi:MAG: bifunctional oligoribonuclease/PAP phosphatase NrnA [Patescibacteria group bacterium]|jgi:phosphoesterase RecJ-like protein